jgi:hypothetical protein
MLEQVFEKQKAADKLSFNDRVNFEQAQSEYWRSLKKRKAEGRVNHAEYVWSKRKLS